MRWRTATASPPAVRGGARPIFEPAVRVPVRGSVGDAVGAEAGDGRAADKLCHRREGGRGAGHLRARLGMARPGGILKQAGPLMLGGAGAAVVGFALPLILTRLLPQAEVGTYKQVWLGGTTPYFILQLRLAESPHFFPPPQGRREA